MAENDFLHSLLSKITASKGDSGGQGEVHHFFLNQITRNFNGVSFHIVYILEKHFYVKPVTPPWTRVQL